MWLVGGYGGGVLRGHLAGSYRDVGDFGQAEIQYLGVSALGDENVGRFNIAMDDAFGVSSVERVRQLDS